MNRILELRLERKWTQKELAEKSGVREETISHAENGRLLMPVTLAKLAEAFEIPLSEITELLANRGGGRPRKITTNKVEGSDEIKSEEIKSEIIN